MPRDNSITDPIQHIDGEGEIALCILSAINVGKIDKRDELEPLCDLAVRALDEIIDHQKYPIVELLKYLQRQEEV